MRRKDFLKLIGMGSAALSVPGFRFFKDDTYIPQIGIQLYTVRNEIEKDFEGTVKKVAETGYSGIETYTLPDTISPEYAGKIFRDNGLKVFSVHSELPVGKDRDNALRMADAYQCDTIVYFDWPKMEPSDTAGKTTQSEIYDETMAFLNKKGFYRNGEALKNTVEMYNEISEFLNSKGLKFGLHNHWWGFEKNADGIYPYYYLLEHLDKDVIFEIDTYWTKVAGLDPAKVIKDFGERAPLLHIKDGPAVKGEPMYKHVPAGEGTQDFTAIVKAGGENIKWMIVEFDEYEKDIFDGIRKSYEYLIKNGLSKGKI